MKLNRLVASVSAGFADLVTNVENHETVAARVIEDLRGSAADVRVRHQRVQAQIGRWQQQRSELDTDLARWKARAAKLADRDQTRALECLRRERRAETRLEGIEAQLNEHLRLAEELGERRRELEQRLNDLQLRRAARASRSVSAGRHGRRPRGASADVDSTVSNPAVAQDVPLPIALTS